MFLNSIYETDPNAPGLGEPAQSITPTPGAPPPAPGAPGSRYQLPSAPPSQEAYAIRQGEWQHQHDTYAALNRANAKAAADQAALNKQANPLAGNFVQGLAENKPTTAVDWENMQRKIYG